MRRVTAWLLCLVFVAAPWSAGQGETPASSVRQPNVVLIIIDTLRADYLGCYGHTENPSPELDALSARGVRFADVLAQSSWTRTSIGCMTTSRYPRSLGLYKLKGEMLDDRFTTLAETFRAAGYRTLGVTANPVINSAFNMHQGFDEYVDSQIIFPWMGKAVKPRDRWWFLRPWLLRSVKDEQGRTFKMDPRLNSAVDVYGTILRKVREEGRGPWFVQACIMEVHEAHRGRHSLTRPDHKRLFKGAENREYLCAVRQASKDTHDFVTELASLPGWDNSLFIIASDHGEGLDSHPHVPHSARHGRLLYESHVKVPLILYRPDGALEPGVVPERVRLLDLMPTVLELAGVAGPPEMEGLSLAPLLPGRGGEVALPKCFVTETQFGKFDKSAVYGPMWKLFLNRDGHRNLSGVELQRVGMLEDGERTDAAGEHGNQTAAMQAFFEEWQRLHPAAEPTPCSGGLTEDEAEQIRAIGYGN